MLSQYSSPLNYSLTSQIQFLDNLGIKVGRQQLNITHALDLSIGSMTDYDNIDFLLHAVCSDLYTAGTQFYRWPSCQNRNDLKSCLRTAYTTPQISHTFAPEQCIDEKEVAAAFPCEHYSHMVIN